MMQANGVRLLERPEGNSFAITLGPGVVRYLDFEVFIESSVEDLITLLSSAQNSPEIKPPVAPIRPWSLTQEFRHRWPPIVHEENWMKVDFGDIGALVTEESWENRLRIFQKFSLMFLKHGMPSWVYQCFHTALRLDRFEFDECAKAWVSEVLGNDDLIDSYRKSPQHLVVFHESGESVFGRTSFVIERLNVLTDRQTDNEAALQAEIIRRSQFDSFVYLMQDPRNAMFKIGRSKAPGKRERTLQSEVPETVLRFSIPADESHEKDLHLHFESKRVRGEWFSLTSADLVWIVAYLRAHGDSARAFVDFQWLGRVHFEAGTNL